MKSAAVLLRERGLDLFVVLTHLALGLIAIIAIEAIKPWPPYLRGTLILVWITLAFLLYRWLRLVSRKEVETRHHEELQSRDTEIARWRRYQQLERSTLATVTEFLKDRYTTNHELSTRLRKRLEADDVTADSIIELVEEADRERRTQVKGALTRLSFTFVDDAYGKPDDADSAVRDHFKVTFYAVEHEEGKECLVPKWRYYPNEGEPKTRKFCREDGAAGEAWTTKRIVVCENGGKDPRFKDMWPGGGQKERYASMVCMPAIEDIPSEKMSDVYGVLTVDTPIREAYFGRQQEQFWADLLQPICNLLIYCRESEQSKEVIVEVAKRVRERAGSSQAGSAQQR